MISEGKSFFKHILFREILIVLLIIFSGGVIFHLLEGRKFVDSLYFTTTTMATIGFGDITPQTNAGKIFVMIYAFIGVPLFVSLSGIILETRFNKHLKKYITKFYKELHEAEKELQEVEDKVGEELGDVMKQEKKTETKVEKTAKDIKTTKKKVEKIEEIIEEEIKEKKPRRKVWKKSDTNSK